VGAYIDHRPRGRGRHQFLMFGGRTYAQPQTATVTGRADKPDEL